MSEFETVTDHEVSNITDAGIEKAQEYLELYGFLDLTDSELEQKLLKAFKESQRSYEDVMKFLNFEEIDK